MKNMLRGVLIIWDKEYLRIRSRYVSSIDQEFILIFQVSHRGFINTVTGTDYHLKKNN